MMTRHFLYAIYVSRRSCLYRAYDLLAISSESCQCKPNLDYNYTYPTKKPLFNRESVITIEILFHYGRRFLLSGVSGIRSRRFWYINS